MIPRLKPGENEKIEKYVVIPILMILAFFIWRQRSDMYEDSLENNAMAGSPPHLRVSSGAIHPTCKNKPND